MLHKHLVEKATKGVARMQEKKEKKVEFERERLQKEFEAHKEDEMRHQIQELSSPGDGEDNMDEGKSKLKGI